MDVLQDSKPETDESFYVELYNPEPEGTKRDIFVAKIKPVANFLTSIHLVKLQYLKRYSSLLYLFSFVGDVAVYYIPRATVTIMANDDANGIFSFNPPFSLSVREGDTAHFQ